MSDCLTEEHPQEEHPQEEEYYDETSSLFEQEFSEQDVLPFLLQAQDIISKLESRVVELETDLSTIHRKYEHDRNDWLVGLSQKDQYINYLSSKLQKNEFNTKETIVLLSDLSSNVTMDEQVKSTITLCLNYLRQTEPEPTTVPFVDQDEDLEEGELERRQQAVTEWRRTDIPDHFSTDPVDKACDNNNVVNLMDGLSSLSSSPSLSSTCSHLLKSAVVEDETTIPTTYVVNNDDDNNNFCTNCKQLLTQLDQQIEQKAYLKRDISSLASALSDEEDIRSTVEQDKEALEQDVGDITSSLFLALNQILMDEVTDRDGLVQIHRETMGKLSHVLDAWDTRDLRLKQVKELLVQLDSVVHQSANASCTIARRYSSHPQPSSIPTVSRLARTSFINHPLRFSIDQQQVQQQNNHRIDRNTIRIDGFILSDFQLHIKAVTENPSVIIPLTPFVKKVLVEDVEPCLFFQQSQGWWKSPWFKKKLLDAISKNKCEIQGWHDGSSIFSNYTATTTTTTTTNSSSSVSTSPATSHISSSSQQSMTVPMPPKTKCACCNILRVCEFKMRLPPPTTTTATSKKRNSMQPQPWLPIDRFCRDRLVAVCGYYSFMSHLKLLLASSPLLSTFKQVMHHRRKMSLAKVGSIGLFIEDSDEDDYNDIINRRLSSSSNNSSSSKRQQYQQQRRQRRNRESIVLDHSGSGSDTASIVSVSDIQGIESNNGQIVIVH
ncbi:hypothetical protein BDF21DRAFT_456413 [Thamnidium elegans]|nr:hypothetical protein BDF21DRAFT_456413 [Thamnidium elegans]